MCAGRPYGHLDDGVIIVENERIVWIGTRDACPSDLRAGAAQVHDCGGRCITPGLIDSHTHLVYGGNRAEELELRLAGTTYAEIARNGGGILSTVRATRTALDDVLYEACQTRLQALLSEGATTVEVKSGYGLDCETELRSLRIARELGRRNPVTLRTTYLGLHALPPEFPNPDAYLDFVIAEVLPAVAAEGLADAVDAFCEPIAFSAAQVTRFFQAATALGLRVKLHADQLTRSGGAGLAARFSALSADHLEHASRCDLEAMARAGTVAVLLPGAFYYLRETTPPPVAALRELGIPIAVATDSNPGTSPATSLLLMLNMACVLFGLSPEEALAGATRNAARALGLHASIGTLEAGKRADFVLWDIEHPRELACGIGVNPRATVVYGGLPHHPRTER